MGVLGIAALTVQCPDAHSLRSWYGSTFGLDFGPDGAARFSWTAPESGRQLTTRFLPVDDPAAFEPGEQSFMVRYHVDDLTDVLARLDHDDAVQVGPVVDDASGKLSWAVDSAGQKVELLEAGDGIQHDPGGGSAVIEGVGGVFFRSADVAGSKAWYTQIGVAPGPGGYVTFPAITGGGVETFTAWEVFPSDTTYFDSAGEPSDHALMINFRVEDLDATLAVVEAAGAWIDPNTESYEYGKFAWVVDPNGARIELWQPLGP